MARRPFLTAITHLGSCLKIFKVIIVPFLLYIQRCHFAMKLQCLIFDVDGTLVDNANLIIRLFQEIVLKYLGKKMNKQEVISLWGPPGDEIFKRVFPSDILTSAWNEFLNQYNAIHQSILVPGILSSRQRWTEVDQARLVLPYVAAYLEEKHKVPCPHRN